MFVTPSAARRSHWPLKNTGSGYHCGPLTNRRKYPRAHTLNTLHIHWVDVKDYRFHTALTDFGLVELLWGRRQVVDVFSELVDTLAQVLLAAMNSACMCARMTKIRFRQHKVEHNERVNGLPIQCVHASNRVPAHTCIGSGVTSELVQSRNSASSFCHASTVPLTVSANNLMADDSTYRGSGCVHNRCKAQRSEMVCSS